jgi:hypothetical protein
MAKYRIVFGSEATKVELHMGKPLKRVASFAGVNSWGVKKLMPIVTDEAARRRAPALPFTHEEVNGGEETENGNR